MAAIYKYNYKLLERVLGFPLVINDQIMTEKKGYWSLTQPKRRSPQHLNQIENRN
jgi:hypothetical protein